jgi:transcriptional regulator with XRE-family HTH domain
MSLQEIVARNLRDIRARKKLAQREVAKRAGASMSYISLLERGQRSPPLETLETLARALGVKPLLLLEPGDARRNR